MPARHPRCSSSEEPLVSRRDALVRGSMGMGMLGLAALLGDEVRGAPAYANPLEPREPHFPAKAKRVIHLFMNGGPSQIDTFAHTPKLAEYAGKRLPTGNRRTERHVSPPFDYTDPKVEYEADDRRDPEKEKVKESGSNGFSVTATRVVHYESGEKRTERRQIKYNARPRVLIVHPCMIPKGEKGHTGEKCPKKEGEEEGDGVGGGSPYP